MESSSQHLDSVEDDQSVLEFKQVLKDSFVAKSVCNSGNVNNPGNIDQKSEVGIDVSASNAKARYLLAKLKEEQLKAELEMETQQRLLKAHNEVQYARLEMELNDSPEGSVDVTVKGGVKVLPCLNTHKPESCASISNVEAPYHADRIGLPKVELCHFDGNPREYWKFIRQFENYIEKRVHDDGQRLLYLINYCEGTAKRAIEQCHMLEEGGYERARSILRKLFGQSHVVSQSILDGLFEEARSVTHDGSSLTQLVISLQSCEIALSQMNCEADLNALSTVERIVKFLPQTLQSRWARVLDEINERPTFAALLEFLTREARIARSRFGMIAASASRLHARPSPPRNHRLQNSGPRLYNVNSVHRSAPVNCYVCKEAHDVNVCKTFLTCDIPARWTHVRKNRACYLCLCKGHLSSDCMSMYRCNVMGCSAPHHPLLHNDVRPSITGQEVTNCSVVNRRSNIQLGVLPVRVVGHSGVESCYALIDSGSDVTLVERDLISQLDIAAVPSQLTLTTMNGPSHLNSSICQLKLQPLDGSTTITVDRAFSVDRVSVRTSASSLKDAALPWPHLADIPFQDISDRRVRIIIGTDVPEAHWVEDQKRGNIKEPFAIRTLLGWMILGPSGHCRGVISECHAVTGSDELLTAGLKRLYDAEFVDSANDEKSLSVEDKIAVNSIATSVRLIDGHYEIGLPWRRKVRPGRNNRPLAIRRLLTLRSKFNKDPVFFSRYAESIAHCIEKGYAESAPDTEGSHTWYLPHHAVLNPRKPSKFRVVFDCAAKCNGLCLNDMLYTGPNITNNLIEVLLRFRCEPVAISADIEEMFMQVKIPIAERDAFRFLWWDNDDLSGSIREYRMTVHPFGATSSPYCANYALKRVLQEFAEEIPYGYSEYVYRNFYVDDLLASVPSITEAQDMVYSSRKVLSKGGFRLRKWTSNCPEVLSQLPPSELSPGATVIAQGSEIIERMLGLEWNPVNDCFRFSFIQSPKNVTRRGILATVSSLYDPLGLIAPILLPAKLLLQKLCRQGLAWDEPVDVIDANAWESWEIEMCLIKNVTIPRCIKPATEPTSIQLHVFCDASEVGYGAVVYCRLQLPCEQPHCSLMFAKSKVAPLKPLSIPRLELSAAYLGVRIGRVVSRCVPLVIESVTFWTDSTIVLYYIRNQRTRFSTFVSNRLSTIHDLSEVNEWRYVPSKLNPADLASRGVTSCESLEEWLRGPEFLTKDAGEWPSELPSGIPVGIEIKKAVGNANYISSCELTRIYDRHSEWLKLLRSIIWLTRFKTYMLVKVHRPSSLIKGPLLVKEWAQAELDLVRMVQRESFPEAFQGQLAKMRTIAKLAPVLLNGVLCVGGRLSCLKPCSMRNPPILPRKHIVTEMLIRYHHELEGHAGVTHVLACIRKRFWVLQGGSAVKRILRRCIKCRRQLANPVKQIMAPLPPQRIEVGWFPFQCVGLDYFGPFNVKRGRSIEKRYGCLFSCMQTRAVHLEVSHCLSTDSFLMSLMRFIGRRGKPREIFSDNGTNFVGATKELADGIASMDTRRISDKLTPLGIQWRFNPVAASHRGGVWERMIRSCRRILASVSNEQSLTDEVLCTLFVEVEMILNNRPLVPVYDDVREPEALTPNHLLLLQGNTGIDLDQGYACQFRKGFRQAAYLAGVFWRRWTREYLPTLQVRQKWLKESRELRVGDLVMICSDIGTRGRWPLGVIVETRESSDSKVRTVVVRTAGGLVTRDVRKICWLEGGME